jgi:hypothetical protein
MQNESKRLRRPRNGENRAGRTGKIIIEVPDPTVFLTIIIQSKNSNKIVIIYPKIHLKITKRKNKLNMMRLNDILPDLTFHA